ncbi:MAG TPA: TonB-dependent receptor, partial [Bacteroidales bacterium]
ERVEVIRGPASILYGSNAMGGAINIITRKQSQEGFHGYANAQYGSFNTQKYMAATGYKKEKLSAFVSFNHDQTDGHRDNSDFSINNGYVKLGYELNTHFSANTDFSIAKFKTTDPGPDTVGATKGNSLDITRGYWAFDLQDNFEKLSGATRLFYNFGKHDISDGFYSTDANYGINIHQSAGLFRGNTFTLGFDYMNYGGKAENTKAMNGKGIVFKDTFLYETGVYGYIQQEFFEKLTLNAGLRLQKHEVYGKHWIPSGGFAFKVTPTTTWKASAAKGFRSPSIQELYIWAHNENLSPEKVTNYETGVLQSLFNHKLHVELTVFYVEGDNLIVTVPLKGVQNAGEVENKGLEMSVQANPVKNLSLITTYSFIDMKSPVYATPKHNFFASLRYKWNKIGVNASIQHIKDLDTDASSKTYLSSYTLVNAKLTYQVWKYAEIFASAENLLDQKYETNRYYTMPGTTAFGGVNFKF